MIFYRYPQEEHPWSQGRASISASLAEQNLSPTDFKLSYPLINSLTNEAAKAKINNAIISQQSALFTNHVLLPEVIDFKDVISSYKVPLNEKSLISMLFNIYVYANHAAHGMTFYSSISANLETGQIYEFSDLFNPKIYYTKFLSDIAFKKVKEMKIPLISDYKGITEDQQFYLTPASLVLYYKLYEFTPYYFGNFEIKIPYVEIINLLGPMSPIQKLL